MSSMAALALLAAAASQAPPAATTPATSRPAADPGISADQAMARYQAIVRAGHAVPGGAPCPQDAPQTGQIVVCGRTAAGPRLPLPDERADAGEVIHHPGEPATANGGPPTGPPSRQRATAIKLFGLLREAVTGADPDQP